MEKLIDGKIHDKDNSSIMEEIMMADHRHHAQQVQNQSVDDEERRTSTMLENYDNSVNFGRSKYILPTSMGSSQPDQ